MLAALFPLSDPIDFEHFGFERGLRPSDYYWPFQFRLEQQFDPNSIALGFPRHPIFSSSEDLPLSSPENVLSSSDVTVLLLCVSEIIREMIPDLREKGEELLATHLSEESFSLTFSLTFSLSLSHTHTLSHTHSL
jgi:hypothetical protein